MAVKNWAKYGVDQATATLAMRRSLSEGEGARAAGKRINCLAEFQPEIPIIIDMRNPLFPGLPVG